MSPREEIIESYLDTNKKLTVIKKNEKVPMLNEWQKSTLKDKHIYSHEGNLAWVLDVGDLVIDVDVSGDKKGLESFNKISEELNLQLEKTVKTPSGGFHIYLKIPEKHINLKLSKTLSEYPNIDFLKKGNYCLIPPSKTKVGNYEFINSTLKPKQKPAPVSLIKFLSKYSTNNDNKSPIELTVSDLYIPKSADEIKGYLSELDPSIGYDNWLKIGMCIHSWNSGKEGFQIWDDWSKESDLYKDQETADKWETFSNNKNNTVTIGTLIQMSDLATYDAELKKVNEYIERIKNSDRKNLEKKLIPKIGNENFSEINVGILSKEIIKRFEKLDIDTLDKKVITKMISKPDNTKKSKKAENKRWEKWVYINTHNKYLNIENYDLYTPHAFDLANTNYVPTSKGGHKPAASIYVRNEKLVKIVKKKLYLPTAPQGIIKIGNDKIFNSFNPNSVPKEAAEYSKEGLDAIDLIKKHIKFICTTDERAEILTQWIAHNVQYSGIKIRWAPLIQSIQGTGKSYFRKLLIACLGINNVGVINTQNLISDFNGWSTDVLVNTIEELKVNDKNKHDVNNKLKAIITDDQISVNEKHITSYNALNVTNYICFTNERKPLPLENGDRRWWIIFLQLDAKDEKPNYFNELFEWTGKHASEIRKWFLEYPIKDEFKNYKEAPITDEKDSIIATEKSSVEGLDEVEEEITKGGDYYNKEVISYKDLFEKFKVGNGTNIEIKSTKQKHRILDKLGFMKHKDRIKIDNEKRNIWSKKKLSNDEIRESFNNYNNVSDETDTDDEYNTFNRINFDALKKNLKDVYNKYYKDRYKDLIVD